MKKIVAIIYARFNSSRLPGKVLFTLGDDTIIGLCINKLRSMSQAEVVVATSNKPSDDVVAAWCDRNSITVFRGELNNVALRTCACLRKFPCDAFFRVNADSPFLQIDLYDKAIDLYTDGKSVDLVTNVFERSYPYGIAVELINSKTFLDHAKHFQGSENEHITSYFYKNHIAFNIKTLKYHQDISGKRFVLDTQEDWERIRQLYKADNNIFNYNLSQLVKIDNQNEEHLFNSSKGI